MSFASQAHKQISQKQSKIDLSERGININVDIFKHFYEKITSNSEITKYTDKVFSAAVQSGARGVDLEFALNDNISLYKRGLSIPPDLTRAYEGQDWNQSLNVVSREVFPILYDGSPKKVFLARRDKNGDVFYVIWPMYAPVPSGEISGVPLGVLGLRDLVKVEFVDNIPSDVERRGFYIADFHSSLGNGPIFTD